MPSIVSAAVNLLGHLYLGGDAHTASTRDRDDDVKSAASDVARFHLALIRSDSETQHHHMMIKYISKLPCESVNKCVLCHCLID